MMQAEIFAERIRAHYPEGLTGVFAVGGTRTSYILDQQRNDQNPGKIDDFAAYVDSSLAELFQLIDMYFELGGQNLIVALFSYQGFSDRGAEYAQLAAEMCLRVIDQLKLDFYRTHQIDPYFVGIDTLLHLSPERFEHQLGARFEEFQQNWSYQTGKRKLIWEVAPIPLFSFWRAHQVMGERAQAELATELEQATDLQEIHDITYKYYSRAVYGTDLPKPHFYIGTNRNGDLKLRALLPISLLCGDPFRLYYTPYPSLFMKRETLQAILEDLAFGKPLRSTKMDYGGQITSEMINAEYARVQELSADPNTTLGLTRRIQVDE